MERKIIQIFFIKKIYRKRMLFFAQKTVQRYKKPYYHQINKAFS